MLKVLKPGIHLSSVQLGITLAVLSDADAEWTLRSETSGG